MTIKTPSIRHIYAHLFIGLALAASPELALAVVIKGNGTAIISAVNSAAQDVAGTDSIPTVLDEFVVEGRTQRTIENGVEYIPGKKLLKSASDAASLLFNMQIPQVTVSPDMGTISTLGGDEYTVFINFVAATKDDLSALRPEDVVRVEVLEYPHDPRFNSARHVINFIVHKYEWGGYTKLLLSGEALSRYGVSGALYEKFAFKNWVFDIAASADGAWNDKNTDSSFEKFRDVTYAGKRYGEITKRSRTTGFSMRNNMQNASMRAAYTRGNNYISHTLSFSRGATPESNMKSAVEYSIAALPSAEASISLNTQTIDAAASGYYQFTLPKGHYIQADWKFNHSANRRNSIYAEATLSPIVNNIRERAYNPDATIYYTKELGHNNMLRGMLSTYSIFFDTKYAGSNLSDQNLLSSESLFFMEYMQNWGFGLSLYSRAGLSYVYGRLNGERIMSKVGPRLGLSMQYYINSRHNAAVEGWWFNSVPLPAFANGALYQTEPLMWIKGNPGLKYLYGTMISASYNFIPDNRWNLSATVSYSRDNNMPVYDYYRQPGIDGLVRTFTDDNNTDRAQAKIGASVKLFNNSLTLSTYAGIKRDRNMGIKKTAATSFTNFSQASYYVKNFSFALVYASPEKSLFRQVGTVSKVPSIYLLKATYATSNMKVSLDFRNWFGDRNMEETINSGLYVSEISQRNAVYGSYCRSVTLTLTYTFPYGKKIERNDDLHNGAVNRSAILER